jgi:hypothetical protein
VGKTGENGHGSSGKSGSDTTLDSAGGGNSSVW